MSQEKGFAAFGNTFHQIFFATILHIDYNEK